MPRPLVRIDHETSAEIDRLFGRAAADVRQSARTLHCRVDDLRGGGWLGRGAQAFYFEMDSEVFPGLERLAAALDAAASATRRIDQIFAEAEQEAAAAMAGFGPGGRPAVAGPGVTGVVKDFSGIPEGRIRAAARALSVSKEVVDQNTARQLASGNIKMYYIEDLKQPSDAAAKLRQRNLDPNVYTIYIHPETGQELAEQRNFTGFAVGNSIFGSRDLPIKTWKTLLVHETNHALNWQTLDMSDPVSWYKSEFRAYYVSEYRGVSDEGRRAAAVKEHILSTYPTIKEAYDKDPEARKAIEAYDRPDGDLTNQGTLK